MTRSPTRPQVPVGDVLDRVEFDVERGKIREFARATAASAPEHVDTEAAEAAGLSDVAATATHVVVAGHHRDPREFVGRLGLEMQRIVVGSVEWEYARPLVAGDHLVGTRRVADDVVRESRQGGSMRLVTLETEWAVDDVVAVRQREVLIERAAR